MIDVLGEVRRATAAAERGSWTAAVDGFRRAIRGSGEPVPEALKQNLAACLANRAAAAVQRAGAEPPPDEAEQRRLAAMRAMTYLTFPTESPPARPPARKRTRRWRQSLGELTWTSVLFWIVWSSPVWAGVLALLLGSSDREAGNLMALLFMVFWVFVPGIAAVVGWIKEHWPKPLLFDPYAYRAEPASPLPSCDVIGCTAPATYTVDLGQLAGSPSQPGFGLGPQRLCALHAHGLEEAMSRPVPNPRAVDALLKARKDLEEAAQLDPGSAAIREGLKQVDEILDSVGQPRREGRAAPGRRSTRGRRARAPAKGR